MDAGLPSLFQGCTPRGDVRQGQIVESDFAADLAQVIHGRQLAPGILARTPWGEIAWALAGQEGYERVRASDQAGIAPGAETLRELFGDRPTLILLDELAIYLRKQKGTLQQRGAQLAALSRLHLRWSRFSSVGTGSG